MITDKSIRDRFIECFHEVPGTTKEKALRLKVNKNYVSQLPNKKRPEIKGSIIANFCQVFNYSPAYLLLGEGTKKGEPNKTEILQLFDKMIKRIDNRNKDTEIIHDLLSGMLELNVQFNNPKDQLIKEAKKRIRS
jgi:transcriptional regulator with XRE-family HTH domain